MTRPFMPHRYKSPCYECQRREVGCHGRCKDYKEYAKKEAEYKKKHKVG